MGSILRALQFLYYKPLNVVSDADLYARQQYSIMFLMYAISFHGIMMCPCLKHGLILSVCKVSPYGDC